MLTKQDDISQLYELAKQCYEQDKSNRDKARDFRDCLDVLFGVDSKVLLRSRANTFFKEHPERASCKYSLFNLIESLNPYHHGMTIDKQPTNEEIKKFYLCLLKIIESITGERIPHDEIKSFNQIDYLGSLTDEQRTAVKDHSKIIYVEAGPGTGKTYLLVTKIINYIIEANKPNFLEHIVALSYTNTAANELGKKFGQVFWQLTLNGHQFDFSASTIHSFCYGCMKRYAAYTKSSELDYVIIDDSDIDDLADEIANELGGLYDIEDIKKILQHKVVINKELISKVIEIKNRYKIISVDEILTKFQEQFEDNDDFQVWRRKQLTMLLIDEAQDLTKRTFDIIEMLYKEIPALKIFIVEDPRQNIFTFRGGSEHNLLEFLDAHKDLVSKHHLTRSFRCPQKILDYVNTLVFRDVDNTSLYSKNNVSDAIVDVQKYKTESDEVKNITQLIKNIAVHDGNVDVVKCKTIAVLTGRLKNLIELANSLNNENIPFKSFGGRTFIKNHIKILIHILRVIKTDNPYSKNQLLKWQEKKGHFSDTEKKGHFSDTKIGKTIAHWKTQYTNQELSLKKLITDITNTLDEIKKFGEDFQKMQEIAESYDNISNYLFALIVNRNEYRFMYEREFDIESKFSTEDGYITLSTIHSAKGLEWETVIVPRMSDDAFPNPWRCDGGRDKLSFEGRVNNYNEQVKLLYVAATRSKQRLYFTYPSITQYRSGRQYPSRYLFPLLSDDDRRELYAKRFINKRSKQFRRKRRKAN
ncbi:MAG: UvrD-helicase domain-containing protein [Paludibacteraceae bacterium]